MDSTDKFIEGLYNYADEEMQEVYKKQDENKKSLLDKIAKILLIYTILDNVLKLKKVQQITLINTLSIFILKNSDLENKLTEKKLTKVLKDTVKNSSNFYNMDLINKDALKIVKDKYKGKHFSDRVWDNGGQAAQVLQKQMEGLIKGNISVNDIKKNIDEIYSNKKYEVERLVDTEVARVHQEVFRRYCRNNNVQEIIYKATLCNTCKLCLADHNKIFKINEAPEPPRHPRCKCYWSISQLPKAMNLQLFGFVADKDKVLSLIKCNQIDKTAFNKCYSIFNNKFKNGIKTPIETIKNSNDRFYHIVYRHSELMCEEEINKIIDTLSSPEYIKEAIDRNGRKSYGYIKSFDNRKLLVIAKNDIITAYYPSRKYIENNIGSWRLIWEKE